jgi:hypothetical protein
MYPTTLVEILIRCVTPSATAFFLFRVAAREDILLAREVKGDPNP